MAVSRHRLLFDFSWKTVQQRLPICSQRLGRSYQEEKGSTGNDLTHRYVGLSIIIKLCKRMVFQTPSEDGSEPVRARVELRSLVERLKSRGVRMTEWNGGTVSPDALQARGRTEV